MKKGIIITGLVCFDESFRPGSYGEEYHKVWKCDDYNIQIDSYARKFPDNTFTEKITIDGKKYELELYSDSFAIGTLNHYKEDGEEYSKLESVVEGDNYDKGFFDFTLHINKVIDSKYSYLKGKTLVFHKE